MKKRIVTTVEVYYDDNGVQIHSKDTPVKCEELCYNDDGKLISAKNSDGESYEWEYRSDGHIVSLTKYVNGIKKYYSVKEGYGSISIEYEYDERGNIIQKFDSRTSRKYITEYNGDNMVISQITLNTDNSSIVDHNEYTFDENNKMRNYIKINHDNDGNIVSIYNSNKPRIREMFEYDSNGHVTKFSLYDMHSAETIGCISYEYEADGELTSITLTPVDILEHSMNVIELRHTYFELTTGKWRSYGKEENSKN